MFIPTLFQAGELQYFIQIITIIEWQPVRSLLLNAHRERESKHEKTLIYECGKDNMLSAKRMAKSWRCGVAGAFPKLHEEL
jgi:hypothetical protein